MSDFEKRPADEDREAVDVNDMNSSDGTEESENTDRNAELDTGAPAVGEDCTDNDSDMREESFDLKKITKKEKEMPGAASEPEQAAEEAADASEKEMMAGLEKAEEKKSEASESEGDILDDLEFISHESVRDKSKAATGEVIEGEHVSRKKTKRRSVDAGAAKKEAVQKIVRKNIVLIIIVVIVVICLIVAAVSTYRRNAAKKAEANKEQPISSQEYETDAYTQINELIAAYYDCYAEGNVDGIIQYAYPMSETEQTYIQMYSAFVESYENIVCYTKTGLDDSSYIVSVSFEVKYNDAETTAAGMDFFYVKIADNDTAYIDNTYSPFNLLYQEYSLDQEILQLIQAYEQSDDVIALQAGVQTSYEQALSADESLAALVNGDLASAVQAWKDEYESVLEEKAAQAAAQVEEQTAKEEAEGDTSADEEAEESDEETAEESSDLEETEDKAWVYVNDTVYIREEPSESSEALASARKGSQIRQLATTSNGWTKVKSGDIVGYIKSEYISESATATSSSGSSVKEGATITLTSSVNVRSSMSESSDRVGLAYAGEKVKVVKSYSEGWTKVTWNGETGYIRTDILAEQ
ncbi:MAG: SH3 domain-containing protein [Clostridiales bacterium]|nr:SH3 domain-containing protein [Clostridiales bacterium]